MSAVEKFKTSIGSLFSSVEAESARRVVARAKPKDSKAIFQKLLEDFKSDFYLDFLTVVDYPSEKQIEANYGLWFYSQQTLLTIKFRLPRNNPQIETISDVIPSAVFHEQEAYDLMGITFSGNPDLKRGFLVTDPTEGNFPLRKEEEEPVEQS